MSLLPYPITTDHEVAGNVDLVVNRLGAASSKVMYRRALRDFLAWYAAMPGARFDKATVQRYRAHLLEDRQLAPASVKQKLSAIRGLAQEAADNNLVDVQLAHGISKVKGVKTAGTRIGTWLTQDKAQQLLDAPDVRTLKGVRDQAILAVLLGCGLRRGEAAALTFGHIQQRDGRWVVVDLVGKGQRVRSVPIPSWTKAAIDLWASSAGLTSGRVFRSVRRGNTSRNVGRGLSDQAIADVVAAYGDPFGLNIAAHDLRRTFAKLALKGQARLEQIQLSLGHASRRRPRLSQAQLAKVEKTLLRGAEASGYLTDVWTLPRVAEVIERLTGVAYHPGHVWYILRDQLRWSWQRPARRAVERDDAAIEQWVKQRWPQLKKEPGASTR